MEARIASLTTRGSAGEYQLKNGGLDDVEKYVHEGLNDLDIWISIGSDHSEECIRFKRVSRHGGRTFSPGGKP